MPRRVRPGLQRPGQAQGSPGSLASLVLMSSAIGVITGLAAAAGYGPFTTLRPARPLAQAGFKAAQPVSASALFPPPVRETTYKRVDVYDPPPATQQFSAAPPQAPAPAPARPPAPAASPAPSPTPVGDDGGGGGSDP